MKIKKIAIAVICITMVFALSACSGKGAVLATVEGQKIYQNDVEGLSALIAMFSSMNYSDLDEGTKAQINNKMLINRIDSEALRAHFEKKGEEVITADDIKEMDENADSINASVKEQNKDYEKQHITKDVILAYLQAEKYDAAFRKEVAKEFPVSDDDIAKYYNENITKYVRASEERSASQILIGNQEHTDADRAKGEEIIARLHAGEDFAEIAKVESTDTSSGAKGGDIGTVTAGGSLVESIENAIFGLANINDLSGLVESDYGFHIIKLTGIFPAGQKTLDEASADIKTALENQKVTERYPTLRKDVNIKYGKGIEVDEKTNLPVPKKVETGSSDK